MYGLQGMENHSPEVKQLVAAIGVKLSAADEVRDPSSALHPILQSSSSSQSSSLHLHK